MRFCKDCNNLLYPRENPLEKSLEFWCKSCNYTEKELGNEESNYCVYENKVKLAQSSIKIDPSIINDPTYSRTKNVRCPDCGFDEAIYFQNPNLNDSSMKLVFVCCRKFEGKYCGKWWYNLNMKI